MRHSGTHTTLMDAMFTKTRTYNFEMTIKAFEKVYGRCEVGGDRQCDSSVYGCRKRKI